MLQEIANWFVVRGKAFGALLTDFSRAFASPDHKLLDLKLSAYELSLLALKQTHNYM